MKRVVLAFSGGLDTSVAIRWLAERYGAEVVTVTLDVGQGRELVDVRERALAGGALRAHVIDAREEFARDYVLPSLQAGALYENAYPLATALGRPLISRRLVEMAQMESADAIAHGCIGKINDQVRIEVSARGVDPNIRIITVAREWGMSRAEEIDYARAHGVMRLYSMDAVNNERMRKLARDVGFTERPDPDDNTQVIYSLELRPSLKSRW